MPFKTKRQKVRAEKRLLELVETQEFSYVSGKKTDKSPAKGVAEQKTGKINVGARVAIENNYSYVRGELVKIAILASMIIGLQITLRLTGISL